MSHGSSNCKSFCCAHCGTHVVSILLPNRLPYCCSHRRSFVGSHRESNSHADSISDGITDSKSDGESYCCSDTSDMSILVYLRSVWGWMDQWNYTRQDRF
jgi:hypothetical protein